VQETLYIEDVEQAAALLHPLRVELLKRMDEPRTCPELGGLFSESAQKIYYHVKALEKAGLVAKVDERRIRGVVEGYYQAKARSYWLSPQLVGNIGGVQMAQDQTSLRFLLTLAEEIHDDVGHLGQRSEAGKDVASLGMAAQIYLPDGDARAAFLADVQEVFQNLARKYGVNGDDENGKTFKLILACYPKD
jgi:DNA-binding transcriptional ArsR family regulator